MTETTRLKKRLELIWWVFTLFLVLAVLTPLFINRVAFPFLWANVMFIVIFVTFGRHIFLFKHALWARKTWPKVLIMAGSVFLLFVIATTLGDFNNYVEELGLQTLVNHVRSDRQYPLIRYIQSESIFFGVGSAITCVLLPLRMLMSIWRTRNTRNKV